MEIQKFQELSRLSEIRHKQWLASTSRSLAAIEAKLAQFDVRRMERLRSIVNRSGPAEDSGRA